MKTVLLAGIVAASVVAAAPAVAQVATPGVAQTAPRAPMVREQTRNDVAAKVREHFARMDTNRDGFVTKAEADTVRTQARAKFAENRTKRVRQRQERAGTAREHRFEQLDTNNDGAISRAEFDTAHANRAARVDRNGDGIRDRRMAGMMRKMQGRIGNFGGRMFEVADINKDGRVSMQEAQESALRRFDTADANRDGRITREERIQRVRRVRTERRPG